MKDAMSPTLILDPVSGVFAVTIVIPVWNRWDLTRACLASLAPTLRPGDEVVVVDNGSADETGAELARLPWVRTITNPTNRGFAAACNQGAALAAGETLVFLNNDTLLPAGWLEALLAPFADPAVVATGPMSNGVSGPQWVADADYDAGAPAALQAFADAWRDAHRGQTVATRRLVGFCLAARAAALRAVGGWDERFATGGAEDDDLCVRLADAGGRLLICREAFVHHHGHATFEANGLDWFALQQANVEQLVRKHGCTAAAPLREAAPLLSACLIVRDERELLPGCLWSLRGLADEVVVYDTGSTDGTQELGRAAGAVVVQGDWHDDFARARNAALAHCRGEWVLTIDADEHFAGDAEALRAALDAAAVDAFAVEIVNLGDDGAGDLRHRACRLHRRTQLSWAGRLHEQLVHRRAGSAYPFAVADAVWLIHAGYTAERIAARDKGARNLRLATLDAGSGSDRHPVEQLLNLGRSHVLAGRIDEGLTQFDAARALPCDDRRLRRVLCRTAAQVSLAADRPAAALAWIDELESLSDATALARYLRGAAYIAQQRWQEALDAHHGLLVPGDEDGAALPAHLLPLQRARCHAKLEQWEAAADAAAAATAEPAADPSAWRILAEACAHTGRRLEAELRRVPAPRLAAVFAELLALPAACAERVLAPLVDHPRYRAHALATAIRLAPALDAERSARWRTRLHALGLADYWPAPDAFPLPQGEGVI